MEKYIERNGLHYCMNIYHDSRRKCYTVHVHPARPTDRGSYEVEIFVGAFKHLNQAARKSSKAESEANEAANAILSELMNAVDKERTLK